MFWENILALCNEKGISPNALCSEIGLSNAIATKWKKGAIPHCTTLKKIAGFFDVTPEYLLGRTEKPNPEETSVPNNGVFFLSTDIIPPIPEYQTENKKTFAETGKGKEIALITADEREILSLFESAPPQLRQAAIAVLKAAEQPDATQDADGTKK